MKRFLRELPVVILCAGLVLLIAYRLNQENNNPDDFSFEVSTNMGRKSISCWNHEGTCYVFLPSFTDEFNAVTTDDSLRVNGRDINTFLASGEIEFGKSYSLESGYGKETNSICFMKSENTASVFIATKTETMDQVDGSETHEYKEEAIISVYTSDGKLNYDAGVGSQFFTYDYNQKKWIGGPCWDYDNTLGVSSQSNPNSILVARQYYSEYMVSPSKV